MKVYVIRWPKEMSRLRMAAPIHMYDIISKFCHTHFLYAASVVTTIPANIPTYLDQ